MASSQVIPPISETSNSSYPSDPVSTPNTSLSAFGDYLTQIDATSDGLHYAFIRLAASNKGLSSIDGLENYPHLRNIDISENQITQLSPGLTVQKNLMYLNASKNKVTSIDRSTFADKPHLKVIELFENEIQVSHVTHWPSLISFNLNKNQLTTLILQECPCLTNLEVRENALISFTLLNAPKLEKLYLGGNQLTDLQFLKGKPSVTLVHLRDNKIQSFPSNFDENFSLTYLNLRNNQIEAFEEIDKLKPFINLSKLVLLENPITQAPDYRLNVIYRLPQLKILDKESIQEEEREEGEKLRLENEKKVLEMKLAKEKEEEEAAAAAALANEKQEPAEQQQQPQDGEVEEGEGEVEDEAAEGDDRKNED